MKEKLFDLQRSGKLCEIYSNFESTSKFAVGYIRTCSDEYTIVEMYDPYGHYDGIGCFDTETIFQVNTDTKYLCALNKLKNHYDEASNYDAESICDIENILKIAMNEKRICDIELCESHNIDVTGFVVSFDNEVVEIEDIDKYGKKKGMTTIRRKEITELSFDTSDTIKTEILYK